MRALLVNLFGFLHVATSILNIDMKPKSEHVKVKFGPKHKKTQVWKNVPLEGVLKAKGLEMEEEELKVMGMETLARYKITRNEEVGAVDVERGVEAEQKRSRNRNKKNR